MTLTRRGFLHGSAALLGSAPLWRRSPAAAQQAVRPAPGLPAPRFVDTNGIRMGVYTAGAGTPVVLCHGFPELAFSWRHQISAFADAGLRVIAPDLRGYGLTDRPMPVDGLPRPQPVCRPRRPAPHREHASAACVLVLIRRVSYMAASGPPSCRGRPPGFAGAASSV